MQPPWSTNTVAHRNDRHPCISTAAAARQSAPSPPPSPPPPLPASRHFLRPSVPCSSRHHTHCRRAVRSRSRARGAAHLGDADDHVFDVRARRLDGGTRLARGEPALNVDDVLTFLVLGHRDVERQVRQVLFDLAARALDYDHACLHGDLDPIRDRNIGLLQYGLLRVREYGAAQQTISERKPRTRRGGGSGAKQRQQQEKLQIDGGRKPLHERASTSACLLAGARRSSTQAARQRGRAACRVRVRGRAKAHHGRRSLS